MGRCLRSEWPARLYNDGDVPNYLEIQTIWIENGRNIEHMNYETDNDIGSFWVCEVSTLSVAQPLRLTTDKFQE